MSIIASDIEKKWQKIGKEEAFKVGTDKSKPKYYALLEFPIRRTGLHVDIRTLYSP